MKKILFYTIIILLSPMAVQAQVNNWEWAVSGTDQLDGYSSDVVVDAAGNSYVVGTFSNTLTLGTSTVTSNGGSDLYIAKFDPTGQLVWINTEGGNGEEIAFSVAMDASGNLYLSGSFSGNLTVGTSTYSSAGGPDILLIKYDSNGNLIWSKAWGGIQTDVGMGIAVNAGRIYMTGYFRDTVDLDGNIITCSGITNIFLLKADTSGTVIWAKQAGGNNGDFGRSISVDTSGGLYITGFGGSTTKVFGSIALYNFEVFVVRYDTNGNALWARGANGLSNFGLGGSSIKADMLGNVYTVGYGYNGQDISFGTVTLPNSTNYIAKYNSSGTLQWAKHVSELPTSAIRDLVLDAQGNIYIAGYLGGAGIFGNDTIYTNGGQDVWVAKLDNNGNHLWSAVGGGAGADGAYALALDNNGSIVITGYIASSTASFGPYTVNGGGGQDMCVAKLSQTNGLPMTAGKDKHLYIYPNPVNDILYIKGLNESTNYKIAGITGAILQEGILSKNRTAINIKDISPGIYLLYAAGEVHKIVKQ